MHLALTGWPLMGLPASASADCAKLSSCPVHQSRYARQEPASCDDGSQGHRRCRQLLSKTSRDVVALVPSTSSGRVCMLRCLTFPSCMLSCPLLCRTAPRPFPEAAMRSKLAKAKCAVMPEMTSFICTRRVARRASPTVRHVDALVC